MTFGPQTFNIGELDQRVTIQRFASIPDGVGGFSSAWVNVRTVWAKVRPRSTKEAVNNDRVDGSSVYMFVMRYRDIDHKTRFVWKDIPFNVFPALDGGRRGLYIVVDAVRGVAQ